MIIVARVDTSAASRARLSGAVVSEEQLVGAEAVGADGSVGWDELLGHADRTQEGRDGKMNTHQYILILPLRCSHC